MADHTAGLKPCLAIVKYSPLAMVKYSSALEHPAQRQSSHGRTCSPSLLYRSMQIVATKPILRAPAPAARTPPLDLYIARLDIRLRRLVENSEALHKEMHDVLTKLDGPDFDFYAQMSRVFLFLKQVRKNDEARWEIEEDREKRWEKVRKKRGRRRREQRQGRSGSRNNRRIANVKETKKQTA